MTDIDQFFNARRSHTEALNLYQTLLNLATYRTHSDVAVAGGYGLFSPREIFADIHKFFMFTSTSIRQANENQLPLKYANIDLHNQIQEGNYYLPETLQEMIRAEEIYEESQTLEVYGKCLVPTRERFNIIFTYLCLFQDEEDLSAEYPYPNFFSFHTFSRNNRNYATLDHPRYGRTNHDLHETRVIVDIQQLDCKLMSYFEITYGTIWHGQYLATASPVTPSNEKNTETQPTQHLSPSPPHASRGTL